MKNSNLKSHKKNGSKKLSKKSKSKSVFNEEHFMKKEIPIKTSKKSSMAPSAKKFRIKSSLIKLNKRILPFNKQHKIVGIC